MEQKPTPSREASPTMKWAVGLMLTLGVTINIAVLTALASSHKEFVTKDSFSHVIRSLDRIERRLDFLIKQKR